jgi:hypothetical protein
MNIRKTVKKIAALVAGTTMLGATIMGAVALDLSDYPAPFVASGVFDGKIVVGANAATSDVVGAIDLAASLQAESTTTTEIDIPGSAGTATVVGDSAEFKTFSDIVGIGEVLGDVKTTFTADDLEALKSGIFDTGGSSTPVKQYLRFGDVTASVVFEENDDDIVADFLKFPDGSPVFEYHIEFTEGAESELDSGTLEDLEGETLTMIGSPFTIVEATLSNTNDIKLVMLGGEVADTLRDGETKTYTIDGVDYEVTAVFIDSDTPSAKLSVNGMLTKELEEGDTDVLGVDVTIGVQEILTNQREGLVEFYLGANKLSLTDTDYEDTAYETDASIKVGTESIDNADLIIKGTNGTDEITLNFIKYRVEVPDDVWVPAGKGVKEFLEQPEGMLTGTWDIVYAGLMKTGVSVIKFDAQSDHSYDLEFENVNGDSYDFPYITNKDANYKWGDDDDDFIFTEATTDVPATITDADYFIYEDDYFMVSDGATDNTSDTRVVSVLRYQSIRTSDTKIVFRDLAGDTLEVSYSGTPGPNGTAEGELIVGGESHRFWVDADPFDLAIDLDASGATDENAALDSAEILMVVKGGGIMDLGAQTFNGSGVLAAPAGGVGVTLLTPTDNFDETPGAGTNVDQIDINVSGTDEITLSKAGLNEWDQNEDYDIGMNIYGTFFKLYNPDTGARELTIEYPLVQKGAQVFVTAGVVEVKEGTSTSGGTVPTTDVNPIAVGLAVLDTNAPAIGTDNLIVVGGPCANTVAFELMGQPENCAEGFEPGKAVIKLYATQNALLVAGYEAQETLGACYVLADYEDYDLTGTEVEVVVADLNTITVNPVS